MKRFRAALFQLDAMSSDTALQAVKQVIFQYTQFFYSLSLDPPASIDELFLRGNQYSMLEDYVVSTTKRTVSSTSNSRSYGGNKGKRGRDN